MSDNDRLIRIKMDSATYNSMQLLMEKYGMSESEVVQFTITRMANTLLDGTDMLSVLKGE